MNENSIRTYNEIVSNGLLSKRRLEVYSIIHKFGPMIGSDVSRIWKNKHGNNQQSENVRNRITELRDMGCVAAVGNKTDSNSMQLVTVWQTTENLPIKLKPKITNKQKIARLESNLLQVEKIIRHLINADGYLGKQVRAYFKSKENND